MQSVVHTTKITCQCIRRSQISQLSTEPAQLWLNSMNLTAPASTHNFVDLAIPDWLQKCLSLLPPSNLDEAGHPLEDTLLIGRAFEFAYQLHRDQYRASGEPYICHPVAVAGLLRDLGGSNAMIAAGFLHDIVEDTDVTPAELEQQFGTEVRQLV